MKGWGERLKKIRQGTLASWSASLGIHSNSWAKYEKELMAPSLDLLAAVKEKTNVNLDWLVTGVESFSDGNLNTEILAEVFSGMEKEGISVDNVSRAKLVAVLYREMLARKRAEAQKDQIKNVS